MVTSAASRARRVLASPLLNVAEHFGPTIQGEGRHAGALASFLRLSGCNLSCSWCDTPYTWDWTRFDRANEFHREDVRTLATTLAALPGRLVVSGGEPLLQAPALGVLLLHLRVLEPERGIDLETNGTRPLGATAGLWTTVTASPKIGRSSGQGWIGGDAIHSSVLDVADLKFVIADLKDLQDTLDWISAHPAIPAERIWLMPEGRTAEVLTARATFVMNAAARLGFNYTSRLHVYGWADTRGH